MFMSVPASTNFILKNNAEQVFLPILYFALGFVLIHGKPIKLYGQRSSNVSLSMNQVG